ncbi:MAG: helix-turn-helix domain-containing protein [bacterium]|nr:helix-turn-helix domain-containing protein [bacterium]
MEQKTLKEIILERIDSKGLNFEKVLALTGVPKHYLDSIISGEWHKLPAAPYTHGYFKKLEAALECAPEELWEIYKEEAEVHSSGAADKLPENRFAIKKGKRLWVWPLVIGGAIIVYLAINLTSLIGIPKLDIISPLSATVIAQLPSFELKGVIDPRDKAFINNEELFVDNNGQFQENYNLQPGLNTFEITAKRFLGRETKVFKQIIYQPELANPK